MLFHFSFSFINDRLFAENYFIIFVTITENNSESIYKQTTTSFVEQLVFSRQPLLTAYPIKTFVNDIYKMKFLVDNCIEGKTFTEVHGDNLNVIYEKNVG